MKHFYYNLKFINALKHLCLLLFFITGYANAQTNAPEINVKQGTVDKGINSNYAFADQNVNTISNAVTFTVENSGTANLTVLDITLSGPDADQFTLIKNTTPTVIAVGGTTTFTINFSPKNNTPDAKNAVITIVNDDENESSYAINLTGTAVILKATISSFTPSSTTVGATVTINGTNLINTSNVTFNGLPASSFAVVSDIKVTAVVPAGAVSGPISVINPAGEVKSTQIIKIIPRITSFTPTTGVSGSTTVIITGTSFTGATSVKFNGLEAAPNFTVNSSTQISVLVPAGATLGRISVTTPSGTGTSTQNFTPPPTITSLSATFGIIGNQITIKGTNFPNLTTTVVKFTGKNGVNTVTASRTVVNSTQITVTVPVGAVTGPITVTTIAGSIASPEFSISNTTYTWNSTSGTSGDWAEPTNWTPNRTSPSANDVLQFDGSITAAPIVNLNFASTETIGYLSTINNAAVTFIVAEDKVLNIDNNVAVGADFVVTSGSSLTVTNSIGSNGADLIINVTSGETSSVAGIVTFQGEETAEHRLLANTNGLTFTSTGRFIAGANLSGSPFSTATTAIKSSVVFANGAIYYNQSENSLPFGADSPNAVVVFNPGSTYNHQVNSAPDVINRTYSNFIISAATAFNQTVTGTSNLQIRGFLTLTAPSEVPDPVFNLNLEGTTTITGNLTLSRGALNVNPAGTAAISLAGSIAFANNSALNIDNTVATTTFKLTGANKTISGAGTMLIGDRANLTVETGAFVTLSKNIIGTGQVTVNGTVRTANTNGLAGGTSTSYVDPLQVTLNPGSTVDYNATINQSISGLNYANLTISGVRTNRTITLPSSLRVSGAFSLTATGTNVIYNTTTNNNTIEFNGGNQTIPAFNYNNVTISGTGDKTLAADVTINGNLDMVANELYTFDEFNNFDLTLGSNATITGESSNQYVIGNLNATRNITSAAGSDFGGMGITIGLGSLGSQNLGLTTVKRVSGPNSSVQVGDYQGINRTWDVRPTTQPTNPIDVTLSWVADDNNGKNLTAARVWKTQGEDRTTYYDVSKADQDANSQTITVAVSSFSVFTVSDQNNPLPVELISFDVAKKGSTAVLIWQTATEINNQGFAVEISEDARTFKEVSFIQSTNSNSGVVQNYAFTHRAIKAGTLYYRLKQTDWNGATRYYGPKAVTFDQVIPALSVYPNPLTSNASALSVLVGSSEPEKADVTVTDILGKVVYSKSLLIDPAQNEIKVNLNNHAAGVYIIRVVSPSTGTNQTRIIKQ